MRLPNPIIDIFSWVRNQIEKRSNAMEAIRFNPDNSGMQTLINYISLLTILQKTGARRVFNPFLHHTVSPGSIGCPHSGGRLFCFASPGSLTELISTINIPKCCVPCTGHYSWMHTSTFGSMSQYFLGVAWLQDPDKSMYKSS
jgi:hypothetical protein